LGQLRNNGGPNQTQALLPGSLTIDKGNSSGSDTDQRGLTRPVGSPAPPPNAYDLDGSDIGAFEVRQGTNFADVDPNNVFGPS
jgi:hypothetical protein